jgi:hypothetical protein
MFYPIIKRKRIPRGPHRLISRRVVPLIAPPVVVEAAPVIEVKKPVRGKPFPPKP